MERYVSMCVYVCLCVSMCVYRAVCVYVSWFVHTCDMIRVTWLVHTCDMTHPRSPLSLPKDLVVHVYGAPCFFVSGIIRLFCRKILPVGKENFESTQRNTIKYTPGSDYGLFYRALLQKRPVILRSLLILTTPYVIWLIHICDMTDLFAWHNPVICVMWLIHMCDMNYSCVWRDSFIRVTWLIQTYAMTLLDGYCSTVQGLLDWFEVDLGFTELLFIHVCDMTHSEVCHDSSICVTWLIHMCDTTESYVWHDSFIRVTWLIQTYAMTHPWSPLSLQWRSVCSLLLSGVTLCLTTHSYMWHD